MLFSLSLAVSCGSDQIGSSAGIVSSVAANTFSVGIAHVAGNYGFTQKNFLVEGAERIHQLGSDSILIYLNPDFRTVYPDRSAQSWPSSDPASLADLASTAPYVRVLGMPFKTIFLTAYSFANADHVQGISASPDSLQAEEQEFYSLTKYLYSQYAGSGKTFI